MSFSTEFNVPKGWNLESRNDREAHLRLKKTSPKRWAAIVLSVITFSAAYKLSSKTRENFKGKKIVFLSRYSKEAVLERYKNHKNLSSKSHKLKEFEKKASDLTDYVKSNNPKEFASIKEQIKTKNEREVSNEEVEAKIFSLALRQIEQFEPKLVDKIKGRKSHVLSSEVISKAGKSKAAPVKRLFGKKARCLYIKAHDSATSKGLNLIIGKQIGLGGSNTVFRAYEMNIGRIAYRGLKPEALKNENLVELWKQETAIHMELQKENLAIVKNFAIVDIKDENNNEKGLVQELCDGSLNVMLSSSDIVSSQKQKIAKAQQLIGSLVSLHASGKVHRDIKLDNILFKRTGDNDFDLKLADLGLVSDASAIGDLSGSWNYMPPELLRLGQHPDYAQVAPKADLFALGLVLYQWEHGYITFPKGYLLELAALIDAYSNKDENVFWTLIEDKYSGFDKSKDRLEVLNKCMENYIQPSFNEFYNLIRENIEKSISPIDKLILNLLKEDYTERWSAEQANQYLQKL